MNPIGNRIVVEPIQSTGPKSVIITPESAKKMPSEGIIVAIGQFRTPMGEPFDPGFEIGHRIVFVPAGPFEFKCDGKTLLCVDERDILVTFPKK